MFKWFWNNVVPLVLVAAFIVVSCAVIVRLFTMASDSMTKQSRAVPTADSTALAKIPADVTKGIADVCGYAIASVSNGSIYVTDMGTKLTYCSTAIGTFYLINGWPVKNKDLTDLSTAIMNSLESNDGAKIYHLEREFADVGKNRGILP